MSEFISSGRVIDLALAMVVLEMAALLALRAWRSDFPYSPDLMAELSAGAGLLCACRLLIAGAAWRYPALALGGALAAHIAALQFRWRAGHAYSGQRQMRDWRFKGSP